MDTNDLITKILKATKIEDIINPSNMVKEYKDVLKLIHPDICKHAQANVATAVLNELKTKYTGGTKYTDESGDYTTNGYESRYVGNYDLLKISFDNYNYLMSLKDDTAKNFQKYLPKSMSWDNKTLIVKYNFRSVPLSGHKLPQIHVNWIASRMLEFSIWMQQMGYVFGGFNPETVFVMPENHGIQLSALYLMSKLGQKAKGYSEKYKNWYPPQLFTDKIATSSIDTLLSLKTSIYVLGDTSGTGTKLKRDKDVHPEMLDFFISHHEDSIETFKKYRDVLGRNFKKEFHPLDI